MNIFKWYLLITLFVISIICLVGGWVLIVLTFIFSEPGFIGVALVTWIVGATAALASSYL